MPMEMEEVVQHRIRMAATLEEAARFLERLLVEGPWFGADGVAVYTRARVARLGSLRIEIRPREHPPPHFHVLGPRTDAAFAIEDGRLIQGRMSNQDLRQVRVWYVGARDLLIREWNRLRPTDCPVGPIVEE